MDSNGAMLLFNKQSRGSRELAKSDDQYSNDEFTLTSILKGNYDLLNYISDNDKIKSGMPQNFSDAKWCAAAQQGDSHNNL